MEHKDLSRYYIILLIIFVLLILVFVMLKKNSSSTPSVTDANGLNLLLWQSNRSTYTGLKMLKGIENADIVMVTLMTINNCFTETTDADSIPTNYAFDFPASETKTDGVIMPNNIISYMVEHRYGSVYTGVSQLKFTPTADPVLKSHTTFDHVHMSSRKYKRLSDGVLLDVIFVSNFRKDVTPDSLIALNAVADVFKYISVNYKDNIIVLLEINLHGYEKIFKAVFKDTFNNYVFPQDLYKSPINNNDRGLYSSYGIIVSKKLYSGLSYSLSFPNTNSAAALVLRGTLTNSNGDVKDVSDDNMKNYMKNVLETATTRNKYYTSDGAYQITYAPNDKNIVDTTISKVVNYYQSRKYGDFKSAS